MEASASAFYANGHSLSADIIGDAQVASSLEGGGRFSKLATASIDVSSKNTSYLVGLYDVNSEFDVLESAGLFINSAHGIGSEIALSGQNGPSIYPFYSLALRGQWKFENSIIRAAVMDGVPGSSSSNNAPKPEVNSQEGYFSILEYEYTNAFSTLLIGAWQYSKSQKILSDRTSNIEAQARFESGNYGAYIRHETMLGGEDTLGFVRFGYANSEFNQFDLFTSIGITQAGLFNRRPNDIAGLAVAYVRHSQRSYEASVEATYQFTISETVFLQPNIQFIANPGAEQPDALALGVRFSILYD
jgi:porin